MSTDELIEERAEPARPQSFDNAPPASPGDTSERLIEHPLLLVGREVTDHLLNRRRLLVSGAATGVAATALTLGAAGTIRSQESTPAADATSDAMAGHDMDE